LDGVAGWSQYERSQIAALLRAGDALPQRPVEQGVALVLVPVTEQQRNVHDGAVLPAVQACGLNLREVGVAFDDTAPLSTVYDWLRRAQVIVADVTALEPSVVYLLGLCHGVGRSPLLIARRGTRLPFNLCALRCVEYDGAGPHAMHNLRRDIGRAVRVFLEASRHGDVT
jgi:hypothetical protein